MILPETIVPIVKESFAQLKPNSVRFSRVFYDRLFEADPSLKPLFIRGMKEQREKFFQMLEYVVKRLDNPASLESEVRELGIRHQHYDVKKEHYATFFGALIYALAAALGNDFTVETRRAWCELCEYLGALMHDEIRSDREVFLAQVKKTSDQKA
jgi:methyl-accepting chemotaxis protein